MDEHLFMKIVLVADDERNFRGVIRRLLETEREEVVIHEAVNGHEAIQMARQLRPDLILLDLAMPDCNGLEAARRIRAEWASARIVICSVHSQPAYRTAALDSGADQFLLKKNLATQLPSLLHHYWAAS